jgi:hypothetical protein
MNSRTLMGFLAASRAALRMGISSSSTWRAMFPTPARRRSRDLLSASALAAAALRVVVDLSPAASKREIDRVKEEAISAYQDDIDHLEINPRGYAFRHYAVFPNAVDGAGIDVTVESGKISVRVLGAQ